MSEAKHFIVGPDGDQRAVDPQAFQDAIDRGLAQFNGGVVPTTDDERRAIINLIRSEQNASDANQ